MTRKHIFSMWIFTGIFSLAMLPSFSQGEDSLDVTITGESKDEIPLTKPPASAEVTFDHVATLSRDGHLERVLSGPIIHMTGREQMALLHVESRQTYLGLPVRIPEPPFIRMEISPVLSGEFWELQVLDQSDRLIKAAEGVALPKHVLSWDGFQNGVFRLRVGTAYTPVLALTDDRKRVQRHFGEPVRFSVLQYAQDGLLNIEFDNTALFERGRSDFSLDMAPYLQASLNVLRRKIGKPIRVVLYSSPGGTPSPQSRLEKLQAFYMEGLALEKDMISFSVQPAKDRGDITLIMALDQ